MYACSAAMTEAKQVEDATRTLHASQRGAVSNQLLADLETLQKRLEMATNTLFTGRRPQKQNEEIKEEAATATSSKAKTLARQILLTQELQAAANQIRELEKLMPLLTQVDDKQQTWWKKFVQKVVIHAVELVKGDTNEAKWLGRLNRTLNRIEVKCPELKKWHSNVQMQIAAKQGVKPKSAVAAVPASAKSKKKRAIPLPDDGETPMTSSTATSVTTKKAKTTDSSKAKEVQSVEKTKALLQRCSREVRTLRDKFELGAYDVNLSRIVTVVDALWTDIQHSDVISLTTALFTLVETVEKVVNQPKRRDRLACLESVLGVVLNSPKLHLTARRRAMVEEYTNNCRQSLEQLNKQSESSEQAVAAQASGKKSVPASTGSHTSKGGGGLWPKSHVRFG
ncbi:hypothetical protein DVH05_027645 [Phytophthora capsici]|nr:hypothetical protein DVH05_027645 [Phytophthora capsici]